MKLRSKLLLVAIVPLVLALVLTGLAMRRQQHDLAERQQALVRRSYSEQSQSELRHFVALALSTVSPLYNTGRDDDEIKQQAIKRLAQLDYGPDGYFFVYHFDGTNLMHPRQPELVGQNLLQMQDTRGQRVIREMINKAESGGGFVDYTWLKPSSQQVATKLAYVTSLERWRWMIGTGLYTDDTDGVIRQLEGQLEANVNTSLRWLALIAGISVTLVVGSLLLLSTQELRAADAKLILLTRRLVRSQEDERAWLSRELHDGTSQTLVSVKLLAEAALARLNGQDHPARPVLQLARDRLNEVLDSVRNLSHGLRPAELDQLGLATALRQLGEELCESTQTSFEWQGLGEPAELPVEVRTTLFRVSQEALTNVHKHARARTLRMVLEADATGLRLSIEDDGVGFDSMAVAEHPRRGIGLRNMRERMATIGGTLQLQSSAHGTRVLAELSAEAIARLAKATP